MRSKIMIVVGTRPEVIKMAPVVEAFRTLHPKIHLQAVSTGQHETLLNDGLAGFNFEIDKNLGVSNSKNDLRFYFSELISELSSEIDLFSPDLVLVHGDTSSASAAAIAAHLSQIPVGHVEAGLRSYRLDSPWPEESNRRIIDSVSTLFFCPTEYAKEQIVPDLKSQIFVTGNTVIDALKSTLELLRTNKELLAALKAKYTYLGSDFILVTQHRRESFGEKHEEILIALNQLATKKNPILFPVHPNPNIRATVSKVITNNNIYLVDPVPYPEFIYLMSRARMAISDSGGIQEEAPSLGLPLLITRELTERPEALLEKTNEIVGHRSENILTRAREILETARPSAQGVFRKGVFGGGDSGEKIAEICVQFLKTQE
jgi:UDP-N-acetylglucosamine 2-epimerase (non-hydrolysing)